MQIFQLKLKQNIDEAGVFVIFPQPPEMCYVNHAPMVTMHTAIQKQVDVYVCNMIQCVVETGHQMQTEFHFSASWKFKKSVMDLEGQ